MKGARQATVVGVGYSSVHREIGVDTRPLVVDACLGAINDAGLTTSQIDAVFEYPGAGSQIAVNVQRLLGIPDLRAFGDLGGSGPSGLAAAMAAVAAVESGVCDVALVFRSVNREWGQQSGKTEVPPAGNAAQFTLPYGDFGGIIPSIGMKKYRRLRRDHHHRRARPGPGRDRRHGGLRRVRHRITPGLDVQRRLRVRRHDRVRTAPVGG